MTTIPTSASWPTRKQPPPFSDGEKGKGKTTRKVATYANGSEISAFTALPDQNHTEPNRSTIKLKNTINVFNEIKKQLLSSNPELKITMKSIIAKSFSETENNMSNWIERNKEKVLELKSLNIENLNLTFLPGFLANLKNLKVLILRNNKLTSLPEWFGNLENIQGLHLSNNTLKDLPASISGLKKLQFIDLSNNLFEEVPEILKKMAEENKDNRQYRFMICNIGDSQVQVLGEQISLDYLYRKLYIRCLNNVLIRTLLPLGTILACIYAYSFFYRKN